MDDPVEREGKKTWALSPQTVGTSCPFFFFSGYAFLGQCKRFKTSHIEGSLVVRLLLLPLMDLFT